MTTQKDQVVRQVVDLMKKDESNVDYFFSKEKNYKWFESLAPYGFFALEAIKPPICNGESVQYPHWSQGVYLEEIANQIHAKAITDPVFVESYLEILRPLFLAKENIWAMRSIFRCLCTIPIQFLKIEDVQNSFAMVEKLIGNNYYIEFDIHDGYFKFLNSVTNNDQDRAVFKEYVKFLLKSRMEEEIGIRERKLLYFRGDRFKHFEQKFLNFEEVFSTKPYVLEDSIDIISEMLLSLLKLKGVDKSSKMWRPAIEDHYQNQFRDSAPSVLTSILFKTSLFLIRKGILPQNIREWIASNKITFERIYIALASEAPELIDRDECAQKIISLGLNYTYRHEMYHFLEKNFDFLKKENQEKILDQIASLVDNYSDETDERKPLFTAWERMRWLQAIKNSSNQRAKELYDVTLEVTKEEHDHPDFDSYMSRTWVGPTSPFSIDDFDKATPQEIIEMLRSYQNKKRGFAEPSIEGLTRTFEEYVIKEPLKCSLLIGDILSLSKIYLASLFDGYKKCWIDKKFTPVDELLKLAKVAFSNDVFIHELTDSNSRADWASSSIFRFISAGVRDDDHAFDSKFNPICYEILKNAAELVKANKNYGDSSDAHSRAINEPRGVLFETAIIFALREARLAYDEPINKVKDDLQFKQAWSNLFSIIQKPLMAQEKTEVSLFSHLGYYYRHLLFLDKDWLYQNIDLVCPLESKKRELWSSFMQGFAHVDVYVKEMYLQLYIKGHLLNFLRDSNHDGKQSSSRLDTLQERVIALAIIAFLLKDESLDKGLLKEIIVFEDAEEWNRIIRSLKRVLGDDPEEDIFVRAKELISFLVAKFESETDKDKWKKHLEGIGWLLEVFADPSDILVEKIIKIAVCFTKDYGDHYEIVEYLEPFKDSHPTIVGKLFYELIKDGKGIPLYPEDKIISICSSLKNNNQKPMLANICRVYSDKFPTGKLAQSMNEMIK